MEKKRRNTQAEEQVRLLAEYQKEEAAHMVDKLSRVLHLGKYADPKFKSTMGLASLVENYRHLAMAYDTLGDGESAGNAWRMVLRLISQRKNELEEYQENGDDGYLSGINHAMVDAYAALGRSRFEYYLIALELEQAEENRFYCTRRNIISEDVAELQKLSDGEYDMLGISAPPRTYKTALGTRFLSWDAVRYNAESSFFVSHTTKMARKVMDDLLKIFSSAGFKRMFPGISVESNKEDMWIDLLPKPYDNGYHTLYFAGIDSTMAGVINCSRLLYCDDLISGIEEAMKPERMENALQKYVVDIRQRRANSKVKELIIATRWGTNDPLTYMEEAHEGDARYKFIKRPALNDVGESNFMFAVNPLTTHHFADIKARMDDISFECIYQQHPMDRDGLVFTNLKRFKELPKGEPDVIYMACDVAFSGADNLSAPFAYQYGDDVYIADVVFSPAGYTTTEPLVCTAMLRHKPNFARFESNNGGEFYAKDIKTAVSEKLGTRIYSVRSQKNKMYRISQYEPVIQQFYFLDRSLYQPGGMYDKFIRELERFNINGRNKHDDAADSLAMLAEMKQKNQTGAGGVSVMKRRGKLFSSWGG
ncbi:MAG: hypothetical protein NC299_11890 [Lachnospiraceae bacterium]|nr:hypothetical protein [Lachnospiraceae bacterium]